MYTRLSILLLSALLLLTCSTVKSYRTNEEQRSFCYWDTSYNSDTSLIKKTGVNHYYIRYFDVDWDASSEEARPIASIYSNDSLPIHFTPSIFLTNMVFEKSSEKALDSLSIRLKRRIDNISNKFAYSAYYSREREYNENENRDSLKQIVADDYKKRYNEILIDCDWTGGTKDKFFYFIKQLKKDCSDKNITVTLRLWQYKQTQLAGVPPVDRCLLMCYNMQAANNYNVENSIATTSELKKYISGKKYPLTLDVALPVFNWAVLFRNEKFIGLLGNVSEKEYANNLLEYQDMGDNRYRSLVDKVVGNHFIRKGDIVRIEGVTKDELLQMTEYLKSEIPMDKYSRVTFFAWNKSYINNYGTDEIKNIYNLFSK